MVPRNLHRFAIEWVEIHQLHGHEGQFAVEEWSAPKPYVSSANYIKKQGNYCVHFAVLWSQQKNRRGACPFNSLYWHFYDAEIGNKLEKRLQRIGMAYRTLDSFWKIKAEITETAEDYLEH